MSNYRDTTIDVLRCIALLGIIIVHVRPDIFILQLRNFDVPLMVFCSGVGCHISHKTKINKKSESYINYVKRRLFKLIIPCWIFLIFFHLFYIPLSLHIGEKIDFYNVFERFLLYTDWYVWIIRVFSIIAIISPLVYKFSRKKTISSLLFSFIIILILTEYFASISNKRLWCYLIMNIPYLCFYIWGINADRISQNKYYIIGIITFTIFFLLSVHFYIQEGHFIDSNYYKYPPRIYYISYATFAICILWNSRNKICIYLKKINIDRIVSFIGSHTLWIYYWHIPFVIVLNYYCDIFIIKFCVVFISATFITYIQTILIDKLLLKIQNNTIQKYVKIIFIG